MSDLQKYIANRKAVDPEFAENFDEGYKHFKIGVLLKNSRPTSQPFLGLKIMRKTSGFLLLRIMLKR